MTAPDHILFLKVLFIYLFETEGKGEREGEKQEYVLASHTPPTGDLACH